MAWTSSIQALMPHVVKISTPNGSGTGFLSFYGADKSFFGIATAAHVVHYADEWQLPIKLFNEASNTESMLLPHQRRIFLNVARDSAILLCFESDLELPDSTISSIPVDQPCAIGADVGWLGFPAVAQSTLCFFRGAISARLDESEAYLIDGVAINGVSGGPVFHQSSVGLQIIGCVSAYLPNQTMGAALPGLSVAQDVSHFHDVTQHVRSIEEANRAKQEYEAEQRRKANVFAVDTPQAGTSPFDSNPSSSE